GNLTLGTHSNFGSDPRHSLFRQYGAPRSQRVPGRPSAAAIASGVGQAQSAVVANPLRNYPYRSRAHRGGFTARYSCPAPAVDGGHFLSRIARARSVGGGGKKNSG